MKRLCRCWTRRRTTREEASSPTSSPPCARPPPLLALHYSASPKCCEVPSLSEQCATVYCMRSPSTETARCRCTRTAPELLSVAETLPSVKRASKFTFEHAHAPLERLRAGADAADEELAFLPLPSSAEGSGCVSPRLAVDSLASAAADSGTLELPGLPAEAPRVSDAGSSCASCRTSHPAEVFVDITGEAHIQRTCAALTDAAAPGGTDVPLAHTGGLVLDLFGSPVLQPEPRVTGKPPVLKLPVPAAAEVAGPASLRLGSSCGGGTERDMSDRSARSLAARSISGEATDRSTAAAPPPLPPKQPPLPEFAAAAKRRVAELDARFTKVVSDFRELLLFFGQPLPSESALRGAEPEQFLSHAWRLVDVIDSAAKEVDKVGECLGETPPALAAVGSAVKL